MKSINFIILTLALAIQSALSLNIPQEFQKRADDDDDCDPITHTTVTRTLTATTTDDSGVHVVYQTSTYRLVIPAPCATSKQPVVSVTSTTTYNPVSTFTHCEENPHCTSTSWVTPICATGTVSAPCTVNKSVTVINGYSATLSMTTCDAPAGATGSFKCHPTDFKIGLNGASSTFTVTNCDIADFVCPTPTPSAIPPSSKPPAPVVPTSNPHATVIPSSKTTPQEDTS